VCARGYAGRAGPAAGGVKVSRASSQSPATGAEQVDRRRKSVAAGVARPDMPHFARADMLGDFGSEQRVAASRAGRHGKVALAGGGGGGSGVKRHGRASVGPIPSSMTPYLLVYPLFVATQ